MTAVKKGLEMAVRTTGDRTAAAAVVAASAVAAAAAAGIWR